MSEKNLRELMEKRLCGNCLLQEECCKRDYYCPAFSTALHILSCLKKELDELGA